MNAFQHYRHRNIRRGYLLLEAIFGLFLLLLMALLLAATLPISARSNTLGADAVAAQAVVSSKLAQLQQSGYGKLNGPSLGQDGDGLVDGTPTQPTATENADGSQSMRFTFTQTDAIVDKVGANITQGASQPEGTIFLAPYAPSATVVDGKTIYPLVRATAIVRWTDSRGQRHFASGATLIPKAKVQ
ncbi:MAG: hypothetical protein QM758_10545 [Armatimonas sp.]